MKTPIWRKSITLIAIFVALLAGALALAGPGNVMARAFGAAVRPEAAPADRPAAQLAASLSVAAAGPLAPLTGAAAPPGSAIAPVLLPGGASVASDGLVLPVAQPTATAIDPSSAIAQLENSGAIRGLDAAQAVASAPTAVTKARTATAPASRPAAAAAKAATRVSLPTKPVRAGSEDLLPAAPAATPSATATAVPPTATATAAPTATPSATATAVPPTATAVPPTAAPQVPDQGGVPSRITAPEIGLDQKIIPVGWRFITHKDGSKSAEWIVASYAVSWHQTSAHLGEPGNTVLTGHNNIEGEVFRHLDKFNLGDPVTIYSGDRPYKYTVADKFVVQEVGVPYEQRLQNARWIDHFDDERVTLMSCYPYTGDSHRIFVILKPAK